MIRSGLSIAGQPRGVLSLNRANKFTQGLKYLVAGEGNLMRDLAGPRPLTVFGSPGLGAREDEVFTAFDGTNDYLGLSGATDLGTITGPVSLYFRFYANTDAFRVLFQNDNGSNTDYFAVFLGPVTGLLTNEIVTVARNVASVFTPILGYTTATRSEIFDGRLHTVLLTSTGSAWTLYLDGVAKTLTVGAGSNNGLMTVAAATSARLGSRGTSPVYFDGGMNAFGLWTRDMSSFAQELHEFPWQMLATEKRRKRKIAAAAAGASNAPRYFHRTQAGLA